MLAAQAVVLSATVAFADAGNHVKDVKVRPIEAVAGATEIEIVGTSAPVFTVRVESGGKKLIVDHMNADVAGVKGALTMAVGVVSGAVTQAFKTDAGSMTRLTISLGKTATYRVRADGNALKLILVPGAATVPATGPAPADTPAEAAPTHTTLSDVR